MADPVYTVGIEFATGSFTNVTSDVLRMNIERPLGTLFRPLDAGTAMIELANFNGRYSPANAGSAYAGMLLPNKRVQVSATYAGSSYALFSGWAKSWQVNPAPGQKTTVLQAEDVMTRLRNVFVTTSLYQNVNPASLFCVVMSACNVNSFSADPLAGDSIDLARFTNLSAKDCLQRIINFGRYSAYQDGAGTMQLKSRYSTLFSAQNSFVNNFYAFDFSLDDQLVLNDIKINGLPLKLSSSVNTVAWLNQVISIPASGSVGFWLSYVNPSQPSDLCPANSVSVTSSADYLCNTLSGGGGSDLTSTLSLSATFFGETAVCSLFNGNGNTGYLNKFQLRGFAAVPQPAISYTTADSGSQSTYGDHGLSLDDDLIGNTVYIKAYGDSLLRDRKDPLPIITPQLKNLFPDVLAIDVGNVVSLVESLTGVMSQYVVQRLTHDIQLMSGLEHLTSINVEHLSDVSYLILDDATRGVLDGARVLAF